MKKLKAYEVRDDYEGHCVIRFATNSATARREGAQELEIEWESVESCTRKPEFDQYAPGPVPPLVLLKHGWWFECSYVNCGRRVSVDNEQHDDEDELLPYEEPAVIRQSVFCCAEHAARHMAYLRRKRAAEAALCEVIYTRFPDAKVTLAHVYGDELESSEYSADGRIIGGVRCSVTFKLPGLTYDVRWNFGEPYQWVTQHDEAKFRELYGARS